MHKAGVNIALGTDMGFDPEMGTNARELEVYVKLGMKPMDAILSATRNAARALKMEKDLGTVEAGKFADIIAVDGDPLQEHRRAAGEEEHPDRDEGRPGLRRPPAGQQQERGQRQTRRLANHRLSVSVRREE